MRVTPIRCLDDNYAYLLWDEETQRGVVIDPVEPRKVLPVVEKERVTLTGILNTHHHLDHSGGNKDFLKERPGLDVIAGDDRCAGLTKKVSHGDQFSVGNLKVTALHTPGHTMGSICFYVEDPKGEKGVWTGDTLFIAGCGKFFEGTAEDMYHSLVEVLGKLPDDTLVWCGHEYTKNNFKFARHVDPDNQEIAAQAERIAHQKFTVPSTIGDEKKYNVFMRCTEPSMQKVTGESDPVKVLGKLRSMKDGFRG
ncbi:hypothetical protein BZG36_01349 [Bifiguratus adelaidae]|uniref:hydroxyacylglutathione hydrolase n=1 Tax=Bifiguratus adelaidae TaxID=1938954 RepID=A0A261Y3T5_9FUNG|nr:hypothetical protein BZG36_01349 [Bifiguratus adelaidae]